MSVVLAWLSVHTIYLLRYARDYYSPPEGGIDFHGEAPDYVDFAYLALTIGMTFQILGHRHHRQARPPRRARPALLSYVSDGDRRHHRQLGGRAPRRMTDRHGQRQARLAYQITAPVRPETVDAGDARTADRT